MKKTLALAMMMVTILTLNACGGNSSKDRVVNVCSWGEYIDESLIDQFEKETGTYVVNSCSHSCKCSCQIQILKRYDEY